jgi:integrase/recombinase XerC
MTAAANPIEEWLRHLEANRRYSPHTLDAYRRDLSRLVEMAGDTTLDRIANGHIRQFIAQLHGEGLGPRSLARMLASWRGFYKWWIPVRRSGGASSGDASSHGVSSDSASSIGASATYDPSKSISARGASPAADAGTFSNPVAGVRAPKAPRSLPKALSVEHAQVLLDRPSARVSTEPVSLRDQAMFELFYSSGLRLSELTSLDVRYARSADYESSGWIDLAECEVTVLGKGGKRRVVPIGKAAALALATWIAVRDAWIAADATPSDQNALFLGTRGRRISSRVVQLQLERAAVAAGLPTHVHPHVLRHSFASHVLQSAQDLRAVQEMLGHTNISTTQIYTRLDFQHLAKAYDQAHPRSGRK